MQNAYTAVSTFVDGDGKEWRVQFDYASRAAIRTAFGKDAAQVFAVVASSDIGDFCKLLACGLQRHHPGVTAEDMMKLSPPVALAMDAMTRAVVWSMFGPNGPQPDDEKGPGKDGAAPDPIVTK